MCGRFTLFSRLNALLDQFAIENTIEFDPRYNIAPTQEIPVIQAATDGVRLVDEKRWGLVPRWAKELSIGSRMINARAETVRTKPSFRNAFRKRRCLVPSDGYYEWVKSGKQKIPYLISTDSDAPFVMAGLWETWQSPDEHGPIIDSFTIITTSANDATSDIHDRMPVILDPVDWDVWLDPQFGDADELESLLVPYDADRMSIKRVTTHVNSVRNDDPTCLEEVRELF